MQSTVCTCTVCSHIFGIFFLLLILKQILLFPTSVFYTNSHFVTFHRCVIKTLRTYCTVYMIVKNICFGVDYSTLLLASLQSWAPDNVLVSRQRQRHRNRAAEARKNTSYVQVSASKWSSHNEYRHNAITNNCVACKTGSRCRGSVGRVPRSASLHSQQQLANLSNLSEPAFSIL